MNSTSNTEHFVTLFDSNFLPMGMALHESLIRHARPFHLWIICMDERVEGQLRLLSLPHTTIVPLEEIETPELLNVKAGRTRGEYCWTITPFAPQAIFNRAPQIERVSYVDADVFFFSNPADLFRQFDRSGKHVMITDHGYDPKYDQSAIHGRYCVQFITFRNNPEACKVLKWWQTRCVEWCFARHEDGKFGDQKYLDVWPELFAREVYVLENFALTLAPWNVDYVYRASDGRLDPVFYHFHSTRIVAPHRVRLYMGYRLSEHASYFYEMYLAALRNAKKTLAQIDVSMPCIPDKTDVITRLRYGKNMITGKTRTAFI